MLKQFLQALTGSIQTAAYSYPVGNGFSNVNIPPQATFQKILSNAFGSLTSNPFGGAVTQGAAQGQIQNFSNMPGFNNLTQFQAGAEFQKTTKSKKKEAFIPGAVLNSLAIPPQPNVTSQATQLANALNPLQGFAGQTGAVQGNFPVAGQNNPFTQGTFSSPIGLGQGKSGILSLLLGPVVSLFGLIKSFFGLRSELASVQQEPLDKDSLAYMNTIEGYTKAQGVEGSFDENYWDDDTSYSASDFEETEGVYQ